MKKYIITTVTFFLILVGCSTDDSGIENIDGNDPDPIPNIFNRQNMLVNWVDNIIAKSIE